MIRKILTAGFLGLFGIGLVGATVFGAIGMAKSVQAAPASETRSAQGPFTVEFTSPHMPETIHMTFTSQAEAEQFASMKKQHGYAVTLK